jgi:hypothetical protein
MAKTIHGMCNTRLYEIWNGMKQRCQNPNTISYKGYGGKGISVCEEWNNSFKAFYDWAISNGYRNDLTIDRIENDGNYEPANCRWATNKEQQNHTSYTRLHTYNGETLSIMQWAEKTGIHPNMLYKRLSRGWSIEKALKTKSLMKWGKTK